MKSIASLKGRKFVKDLVVCLKDMEPYVRAVKPLWSGRPFSNFSLRAREIWSLWLLCAVMSAVRQKRITFGEDDQNDGVLADVEADEWIFVENVAAMDFPNTKLPLHEQRVIDAIMKKAALGDAYASGKVLVVFFDGAKRYYPNRIAKAVEGKHSFERVYLVGLLDDRNGTQYSYSVCELGNKDSAIHIIDINPDFSDWSVATVQ